MESQATRVEHCAGYAGQTRSQVMTVMPAEMPRCVLPCGRDEAVNRLALLHRLPVFAGTYRTVRRGQS